MFFDFFFTITETSYLFYSFHSYESVLKRRTTDEYTVYDVGEVILKARNNQVASIQNCHSIHLK